MINEEIKEQPFLLRAVIMGITAVCLAVALGVATGSLRAAFGECQSIDGHGNASVRTEKIGTSMKGGSQ